MIDVFSAMIAPDRPPAPWSLVVIWCWRCGGARGSVVTMSGSANNVVMGANRSQ